MTKDVISTPLTDARDTKPRAGAMCGDSVPDHSSLTLGRLLRTSRVARSISLDEVSTKTHIAVAHLAALENDETISLPHAFTRGYAKSYAEYLGIEPEYLTKFFSCVSKTGARDDAAEPNVAEHEPAAATTAAEKLKNTLYQKTGFRSGSSWSNGLLRSPIGLLRVATTTTLPLLCLCVLAYAYHSIDSEFSKAQRNVAAKHSLGQAPDQLGVLAHEALTAQLDSQVLPAAVADAGPATAIELQVASPAALAAVETLQLEVGAVASAAVATAAVATAAVEQVIAQPTLPDAAAVESMPVGAAQSLAIASPGRLAFQSRSGRALVPNTNMQDLYEPVGPGAVDMIAQLHMQDRLVIQVYEDSWVDVRDGSGSRLYRDLARAGRRIDVSGQLPFSLHLGNAPGLELELNGEPIAIERYRPDNSARLTLASN